MPAGSKREKIAFETLIASDDGAGGRAGAWSPQFEEWAAVEFTQGREDILAARLTGAQPATITVHRSRRTAAITPGWRLRDTRTGVIYNIRAVSDPDGRHREVELLCESGVAT